MSIKRKKLETMIVTLTLEQQSFESVLNELIDRNFSEGNGKTISLHKIRENVEYFLGYVNTTKKTGIPPKHIPQKNTYEQLPIDENTGEGLGYSNVFIYDKQFKILMYEGNKNGCYLAAFRRYIITLFNDGRDESLDIGFSPFLRLEAYERMLNVEIYKSIEVKIANPVIYLKDFLDENDALTSAINTCKELNSDTVDLKFDIKGRPLTGMPSQSISHLIKRIKNLATNYDQHLVEKFIIEGYYYDPDDDVTKKEVIDFLLDRYIRYIVVDEPNILSNPQTLEKSNSLLEVYLFSKKDFEILSPAFSLA